MVIRGNMLMKWSHVAPDGKYKAPPNATIAYSSLIRERLLVVRYPLLQNTFRNLLITQFFH